MSEESSNREIVLKGTAASAGVADGKALLYLQKDPDVASYDLSRDAVEMEIKRFDQAIAADPKLEQPRFNKGIVLMHDLDDREGAIKAWEGLLEVNPLAKAPNGQTIDEMVNQFKVQP